jgi:two-component system CheB/CheR fusion protein
MGEDEDLGQPRAGMEDLRISKMLTRRLPRIPDRAAEANALASLAGVMAEFLVRLPLLAGVAPPPSAPGRPADGRMAQARRRVLIVDDNREAAETVALLVRSQGHEVKVAFDGPSACASASSEVPDLVLLDIGLPGMDGYQVARRLRSDASTAGATIVAVSGYGQDEDCNRSSAAGFDAHLVKPVGFEKIAALLSRLGPEATHQHAQVMP